jgi:hypothetical protein
MTDGKMCTTLPGVWDTRPGTNCRYAQNIGTAKVISPRLTVGPIDFFSQQTIADSVAEGLATKREKALAIFYFYITHHAYLGRKVEDTPSETAQISRLSGRRRRERRHGCGVPVERRHGPGWRRRNGLSCPAFG